VGTEAWRNWKAFDDSKPEIENADDELYSDRLFVGGHTTVGPYTLSMIIPQDATERAPEVAPAVRLHVGVHANLIPEVVVDGQLVQSNSDAYHGGNASDEIAALVALTLGVRLRVAGTVQLSGIHEHSENQQPIYLNVAPLAHPGRLGREYIPAALTRSADLDQLDRLKSFPGLPEEAQVELVRAARAYATGLWWANEDQNQSWLQFVTAVEIAANYRQKVQGKPEELVEDLWPELWKVLNPADASVRATVSKLLAPQIRAKKKFVAFLVGCAPSPPSLRPQFGKLDWGKMEDHAKLVYDHRSTALHGGKPFPLPMLERPRSDESGAVQEVPWGLNSGGLGGVWDAKEAPMLLSTFENIARGALLNWWDELIGG
jgi:hypothetical protein